MDRWVRASLLLAVCALASCRAVDPTATGEPRSFPLAHGASRDLGNETSIAFTELAQESRCPKSVVCPWAGEAKIDLRLRRGSDERSVQVTISGGDMRADSTRADSVVVLGHAIQLLQLDPYPLEPGKADPSKYVAHLRVWKASD